MRILLAVLVIVVLSLATWSSSQAQPFLLNGAPESMARVGVRLIHPVLSEDNILSELDLAILSGAHELYLYIPVGKSLNLVGDVPLAKLEANNVSYSSFGNIYVGLETVSEGGTDVSISGGVFLPTASEDNLASLAFGILTDAHDLAKYTPNNVVVTLTPGYFLRLGQSGVLDIQVGPQLFLPTGDENTAIAPFDETQLFFQYGVSLGLRGPVFSARLELLGMVHAFEEYENFEDRFINSVQAKLGADLGTFRMSVFGRRPLDADQKSLIDYSVGLQLELATQ